MTATLSAKSPDLGRRISAARTIMDNPSAVNTIKQQRIGRTQREVHAEPHDRQLDDDEPEPPRPENRDSSLSDPLSRIAERRPCPRGT